MTAEKKIQRISELLNDMALADMRREEYEAEFMKQSVNDLKDEMWRMYCFASDVCNTLNIICETQERSEENVRKSD